MNTKCFKLLVLFISFSFWLTSFFKLLYLPEMLKKNLYLFKKSFFWIVCFMSFYVSSESLSSKIQIPVIKYQLDNGMRILLSPDDKASIASYLLGFSVGSRHEKPGITGISHMFEHLMFKGTKKYPEFNKTYQEKGIVDINAFTSRDQTVYKANFPPESLELILDVESDRMLNLTLTQKELDKERGVVLEERLSSVDNKPQGLLWENLFDLLFIKHAYRQPVIGYRRDIELYNLKSLKDWYNTYYSPNNAVLVISGKFSVYKAKKLINKYFGHLAPKKQPIERKVDEPKQSSTRSRKVSEKEVQVPSAIIAYLGPPLGSREFYALEIINHVLGSGESSLLYKELVRKSRLVPSISSWVWDFLHYSPFIIIYPLLDLSKEEQVKKIVLQTIKEGLQKGIHHRSLEKVKNIQMNQMVSNLKKSESRAHLLLHYELLLNDYKKLYEYLDVIHNLSPEFIQAVGEKYLKASRYSYIILKPKKKK